MAQPAELQGRSPLPHCVEHAGYLAGMLNGKNGDLEGFGATLIGIYRDL